MKNSISRAVARVLHGVKSSRREEAPPSPIDTRDFVFVCGMSRSGTTLLTTLMDAHPEVSMGYELIPPPDLHLPSVREHLSDEQGADADGVAAKFLARAYRAGLDQSAVEDVLARCQEDGIALTDSFYDRLLIASRIAESKRRFEGTQVSGFKLNIPSLPQAAELFPNGRFLFITRDPRDVVASHFRRGFDRTLEEVCAAWNNYRRGYDRLCEGASHRARRVRYEDLVTRPETSLECLFEVLPVSLVPQVFRFFESKASVLGSTHPEAARLQGDFFTTSVGRWRGELTSAQQTIIEDSCAAGMEYDDYT